MTKRAKILIVDDERSIRELLEIFLKKEGFEVKSAPSALEGLTQVKTSDFDLIISDIKMADMSGIDFLREDQVLADAFEALVELLAGAVAGGDHGDDGADANDDAEAGERGPPLVDEQGGEGHADGGEKAHREPICFV